MSEVTANDADYKVLAYRPDGKSGVLSDGSKRFSALREGLNSENLAYLIPSDEACQTIAAYALKSFRRLQKRPIRIGEEQKVICKYLKDSLKEAFSLKINFIIVGDFYLPYKKVEALLHALENLDKVILTQRQKLESLIAPAKKPSVPSSSREKVIPIRRL